ncbi:MAG TPA: aminomethyl-transferring glycine dehydrogenase subunit GcvPB [Methylocystis sp.]|nr:aminomethyl-transferring glycine dehydrogenase subunit GcvPB [Methylocystis sp.]
MLDKVHDAPREALQGPVRSRGLDLEEPLLFETGRVDVTGVDVEAPEEVASRLGGLARTKPIGLPGLSEPEAMRHFVRLSRQNYSIDAGLYPLGSCTMKHNPRLNEKVARLPGFADIHPLQPLSSVQGALELMQELSDWLLKLTKMAAVALSPKAGAHGESCGLMAIKAAVAAKGELATRRIVLVPQSAHGTNPASAALLGFVAKPVPVGADGVLHHEDVAPLIGSDVAAIMLTNPNTCGLFERDIAKIAATLHAAGGYFYCDGANFNALAGLARPGDFGVDAMHINLHKTFSTPHGGGGPGAGPVVFSERLAPFAPAPALKRSGEALTLVEDDCGFGRMTAFHGQMGMFVRALAYLLAHGGEGARQASSDAVLSANYLRVRLADMLSQPFGDQPCMHEALFDETWLAGTGVTTLDFAKALIDEGYHPMTIYFPLVVHGAMLIEPTESQPKAALDDFVETLRRLGMRALAGEKEAFRLAPIHTPRRRLDETQAARKPVLRWSQPG